MSLNSAEYLTITGKVELSNFTQWSVDGERTGCAIRQWGKHFGR